MLVTSTGEVEKQSLLPYDKVFTPGKAGKVVVGKVASLADGVAHLEDGQQLAYDYLVLATGTSSYPCHGTLLTTADRNYLERPFGIPL